MKKAYFLLFIAVIASNNMILPAINQGYYQLDKVFGFPTEPMRAECRSCYKPRCYTSRCYRSDCHKPDCRPKRFRCGSDNCRWGRVFRILDRYRIDPNTYFFKTPERETLLDYAASEGNIRAMKILLNKYRMNITDNALIAAVENNQQAALRFLLDNGAAPTVEAINFTYDTNAQWAINMLADYGFTR